MNATDFKRGDRIRLVKMDDPYRKAPLGITGTVFSVAPPPINGLNVYWDADFSLNPCLDVDVVEKIGELKFPFSKSTTPNGDQHFVFDTINCSRTNGLLNFTHEVNISYCLNTGVWSGDAINSDGWVDLGEDEAKEIAQKLGLDFIAAELLLCHLGSVANG